MNTPREELIAGARKVAEKSELEWLRGQVEYYRHELAATIEHTEATHKSVLRILDAIANTPWYYVFTRGSRLSRIKSKIEMELKRK